MTKPTATPRCPTCDAQGIKHLANHNLGQYILVYCGQCGAIYGVVPNLAGLQHQHPYPPVTEVPAPAPFKLAPLPDPPPPAPNDAPEEKAQYPDFTVADLNRIVSVYIGGRVSLAADQLEFVYRTLGRIDDPTAPMCPKHKQRLVRLTIPRGLPRADDRVWVCPAYADCRHWRPTADTPALIAPEFLAEIGYADLTHKVPYDPAKIAARMKAAGIAQGTQYRRFAIDDGPPACPAHRSDMQRLMVPDGYPNRGRWFWVCLQTGCRNWELAE